MVVTIRCDDSRGGAAQARAGWPTRGSANEQRGPACCVQELLQFRSARTIVEGFGSGVQQQQMGAPLERRSGSGRGGKGGGTTLLLRLLLGLTTAAAGPRGAWGCDCSTQTLCDQCAFGSVLSIMSARQQDIAIQTHGCTAIGNAVSSRIGDLDGSVEAVIGAMKAFPGDLSSYKQLAAIPESSKLKTLQQSCCETLVALAGAGGLHVKIQQANGAAVITSAMLAFPDELPLQRTAVLTLGNLIQNQPIASATVESVGGMHATLAAMVAFPTDLHLQQHGKKTVFVSTFYTKKHRFTKTGSGQM
jgi:hypothetical protein